MPPTTPQAGGLLTAMLRSGYATIDLIGSDADVLRDVFAQADRFFCQPLDVRLRHAQVDRNFGYRPFGYEHSLHRHRPDLNDSFTCWADSASAADGLQPFVDALRAYRRVAAAAVSAVLDELRAYFHRDIDVPFEAASYIQVNNYREAPGDRDLLQDLHEDGHLVTVHHTNSAGLEVSPGGTASAVALERRDDQLVLMPGSILTDLTGGLVAPLYHQVRNLGLRERMSVMYFSNPEVAGPVEPFVVNDTNRGVDIAARIQEKHLSFGNPEAPVLSPR